MTRQAAIEGWFTMGEEPSLLGLRCPECGTYVFPPRAAACPNPDCTATELDPVELSRTGTVWSYTVNRYAPPEPYGVAAVELDAEKMIVLGQVAGDLDALAIGAPARLVIDTLFHEKAGEKTGENAGEDADENADEDADVEHVVWKWEVVT